MSLSKRGRTTVALILSIIAAISAAQTTGTLSTFVSADDSLSFPLMLAPSNTEPPTAIGTVEISIQSGQVKVSLEHATPSSSYTAAYISSGPSFLLGTLSTGGDGGGDLQTTLGPGSYSGHFELTRGGVLQFLSANSSFTIAVTVSVSTTETTTEAFSSLTSTTTSEAETTSTTSTPSAIEFQVDPPFRSIDAGKFAKFNIRIETPSPASILLAARNVPARSVAIFTPNLGASNPEFHSTLTIVTATDTPPGTYGLTILALVNGQNFNAQVALEVTGHTETETSTAQTSITTTVSAGSSLSLTLSSDTHHYEPNATVRLQGHVNDDTGSAVSDASISIQVDGPAGAEIIFVTDLKTDAAGVFQVRFKLPANATGGTYTAFVTANKTGLRGATTHTTFVVGTTSTPSVVIRDVYSTDSAGNRSAVFSAGQTVLVWVVIENSGAPFEGVIWVQIREPNGVPISIQLQITTFNTGATVKVAFGFTLLSNPATGLYTANALVSDKLISQGGVFFASADTQFALSG